MYILRYIVYKLFYLILDGDKCHRATHSPKSTVKFINAFSKIIQNEKGKKVISYDHKANIAKFEGKEKIYCI